ncbi:hypothetical protein NKH74_27745 [Mesorhizobium sp. M0933]|uniref:hypothetical protein n=1 Tax=Mesorhizobium sp. M0933 TaxID=2957030 RepID=UPI0033353F9E
MTANGAAYTGLLEVIDGIYAETRDRKDMQDVFVAFAGELYYATIENYEGGPYVPPEQRLPDRWKPFYETYRSRRNEKEADLKQRADEIGEHRFPREEIGAAWNRLMSGDVPDEVRRIWKASSPPRKSGHAIAKAAGVQLKDFVFWMVVLRDHGWMSEDVVQGEHLYANQEAFLRGRPNLGDDRHRKGAGAIRRSGGIDRSPQGRLRGVHGDDANATWPRNNHAASSLDEEKALLAVCGFPAISEADRRAKAT